MAAINYWVRFGSGPSSSYAGLSPTFIYFVNSLGQTLAPPGISEIFAGSGLYRFSYEATLSIAFVCDGATTNIPDSLRYVSGSIEPQDWMPLGIGSTESSFGGLSIAPGTLFGYMKRIQEMLEGNSTYTKATGVLEYFANNSTLLVSKVISESATAVEKDPS